MTEQEIKEIIADHQHWLNQDIDGWESLRANLSGADLSEADLSEADLRLANLCEANLSGANLRRADLRLANLSEANLSGADPSEANLRRANLCEADLSEADLSEADLRLANLSEANLCEANLSEANLSGADLCEANLSEANLSEANLCEANLSEANLSEANLSEADLRRADLSGARNVPFVPMTCPEEGSFIGYKKARGNYIVKLRICEDARRSSATGRKCRCDKAEVLSIEHLDGTVADVSEAKSFKDESFVYKVGDVVEEPNYCEDRYRECAAGIHFFINRQEAVEY